MPRRRLLSTVHAEKIPGATNSWCDILKRFGHLACAKFMIAKKMTSRSPCRLLGAAKSFTISSMLTNEIPLGVGTMTLPWKTWIRPKLT